MDHALLMAVSDDYAFCAANTLLSLHNNSPASFAQCDFIICHQQMSERNRGALQQIGEERVIFRESTPQSSPWLEAACCRQISRPERWGMEALHAFEWLHDYRRVLWLETDTCVCRPLDYLWELNCDFAGQCDFKTAGQPGAFTHLLRDPRDDPCQFVQGAVNLFCDSLLRLQITPAALRERADEYGTCHPCCGGGIYEHFIACLVYYYRMQSAQLPYACNAGLNKLNIREFSQAVIQHFATGVNSKPWSSGHLYHLYPESGRNLRHFQDLGGEVPEINAHEATFFNERCTFEVLHSLDYFREHIMSWPIMRDPRLEFDFFNTSGNLRFHFKAAAGGLFIDLLARQASWFEAQLVLLRPLRTPDLDERFKKLHTRLQNKVSWPGDCSISSLQCREQYGHLRLIITCLSPDATPRVLDTLSHNAWQMLCRPQQHEAKPGSAPDS